MRYCGSYIILTLSILSCVHAKRHDAENRAEYFDVNQDQFTFLVFDKESVNKFQLRYKPLNYFNQRLKKAFVDSLLNKKIYNPQDNDPHNLIDTSSKNTTRPDASDYNLADRVINATLKKGGEKYFSASLIYLFFYECLPSGLKPKWIQETSGSFKFNATFFSLLRAKSKELNELIYGDKGNWDENLKIVFKSYIFNEITPEFAIKIENTILTDKEFSDPRFANDKAIFLEFLDNTIAHKWRLVLLDWG